MTPHDLGIQDHRLLSRARVMPAPPAQACDAALGLEVPSGPWVAMWESCMRLLAILPLENGMKYLGVLFTVLAVASGAIAQDMPRCSPKKAEFAEEFIRTKVVDWSYRRDPGQGGEEYGGDYWIPDPERNVIVEWDAKESSCISCGSVRNVGILERKKGRMSYPAGVHVGVSIDTGGNPTGPAGSYQGTITMSYVPYAQWNSVFFAKYLDCE